MRSLKHYRIASHKNGSWYYSGLPCPIKYVGHIKISEEVSPEEDRRIVSVMNAKGQVAFVYRDYDGFKEIDLID